MEDKTSPFNGLSPAQAERIAILSEECGEVVQICGKILRHGLDSHHPMDPIKVTNRDLLLKEIADISVAVGLLLKGGDLPHPPTNDMVDGKAERLKRYTHHQE